MNRLKSTRLARLLLIIVDLFCLATIAGGVAMLGFVTLSLMGYPARAGASSLPIAVSYTAPAEFNWESPAGSGVVSIVGHDRLTLAIKNPRWKAAGALADLFFWAILYIAALQLRAFLRSVTRSEPFTAANPMRIRRVGVLVIAAALFSSTWDFLLARSMTPHLVMEGAVFTALPDLDWSQILLGLLILLIAQIFELGVTLEEEQALTV